MHAKGLPHDLHRTVAQLAAFQREGRQAGQFAQPERRRLGQPLQAAGRGDKRRDPAQMRKRCGQSASDAARIACGRVQDRRPSSPSTAACRASVSVRLRVAAKAVSAPPWATSDGTGRGKGGFRVQRQAKWRPAPRGLQPAQDLGAFAGLRGEEHCRVGRRQRRSELFRHRKGDRLDAERAIERLDRAVRRVRCAHTEQQQPPLSAYRTAAISAARGRTRLQLAKSVAVWRAISASMAIRPWGLVMASCCGRGA